MKQLILLLAILLLGCSTETDLKASTPVDMGKTLVVYYSYTGNCQDIVAVLKTQIQADVVRIEPVDKTQRYEANGYAIGTQLLNAINAAPDDAGSYPAIDPVSITDLSPYQNIIIVSPLWWSQMAAILQTYLFHYGPQMAGKHVAMIVSSHSSGIAQVVTDAQRLVPSATWTGDALWINNANRGQTASLIQSWLPTQDFVTSTNNMDKMNITIGGVTQSASLVDNEATRQLVAKLQTAPITVTLSSSGDFEIWGPLGFSLPASNESITAMPGDVVLYNGSNICIFYGTNPWSYTRLGHIDGLDENALRSFLQAGQSNIQVTLSLSDTATLIEQVADEEERDTYYNLQGMRVANPTNGIYITNGKKIVK